jgi:hypothetical protein
MSISEYATNSDAIDPDAASANGAMTVAAVKYNETGLNDPEAYSSRGPKTRLFNSIGTRLGSPEVRQKPQIAGADCVSTSNTFIGGHRFAYPDYFCGTSASTPSVAGVAALALGMQPSLTPGNLYAILGNADRTNDCTLAGNPDTDCGYGFLLADRAVSAATLHPAGKYDDRDAGWTYTGAWTKLPTKAAYSHTLHAGTTSGNTASFSFYGNRFSLGYVSNSSTATIGVYLDGSGSPLATVSPNGPLVLAVYTSPVLGAAAGHTVRFVQVGSPIYIDWIQANTVSYLGTGTYDGNHSAWAYNGAWSQAFMGSAYNGTLEIGKTIGGTAEFPFNGTGFTVRYVSYNTLPYVFGSFNLYVDGGGLIDTVNTSDVFGFHNYVYSGAPLSPGNHMLKIEQAGAADSMIVVDSVTIP